MAAISVEQARFNMIEQQVRPWDVLDQRVLEVMAQVPREDFVPPRVRNLAFADLALPLPEGQQMMPPVVEGRLLQALELQADDRVLEIGTGSGYLTACLACLAGWVTSVEIHPSLSEAAAAALARNGIANVTLRVGDAAAGWGPRRYDAIAVTGSLPVLSERWRQQLEVGGRLFAVVGSPPIMEAMLVTRRGENEWTDESLFDTLVPPLINAPRPDPFRF